MSEKQKKIPDYHKFELEEIHRNIQSFRTQRIQIGIFLATANLTLIGIGLQVEKVVILLISTSLVLLFLLFDVYSRKRFIPFNIRALYLESKYAVDPDKAFWRLFLKSTTEYESIIVLFKDLKDGKDIKSYKFKWSTSLIGFWLPLFVIAIELTLSLYLLVFLGTPLF